MKSGFPTIAIASIERVLTRSTPPSVADKFWSYDKDYYLDARTGSVKQKTSALPGGFIDGDWIATLCEVITDASNEIHRKNYRAPADFIVFPTLGPIFSMVTTVGRQYGMYQPNLDAEKQQKYKNFLDADFMGIFYKRFRVYISPKMPKDKILVGLISTDSLVYNVTSGGPVPTVNILTSNDPNHFVNEVSYWGFVNILNLPTEEENK